MNPLAGLIAGVMIVFASAAGAQTMEGMSMPGGAIANMSTTNAAKSKTDGESKLSNRQSRMRPAVHRRRKATRLSSLVQARMKSSAASEPAAASMDAMPGMGPASPKSLEASPAGMPSMPGMSGTSGMSGMKGAETKPSAAADMGTSMRSVDAQDVPEAPPPPPPRDHAADQFFDPAAMLASRDQLKEDHGGTAFSQLLDNLAEYQGRSSGKAGYRWDAEAWFGGDLDRLVLKTEGDGGGREGLDSAEIQALFSHAIGPYFNAQGGVRQDLAPYARTYATVGVEGLAPYWITVEGALFLSTKGEFLARAEALYDLRVSQRLILQPRVELNFAAQNSVQLRTGSGLSKAELGLRLRYELRREFAPYIGLSYDRRVGKSADFARLGGQDSTAASVVAGVRAWF